MSSTAFAECVKLFRPFIFKINIYSGSYMLSWGFRSPFRVCLHIFHLDSISD